MDSKVFRVFMIFFLSFCVNVYARDTTSIKADSVVASISKGIGSVTLADSVEKVPVKIPIPVDEVREVFLREWKSSIMQGRLNNLKQKASISKPKTAEGRIAYLNNMKRMRERQGYMAPIESEFFFYDRDRKIPLLKSDNGLVCRFKAIVTQQVRDQLINENNLQHPELKNDMSFLLETKDALSNDNLDLTAQDLKKTGLFEVVNPEFLLTTGESVKYLDQIVVKFEGFATESQVEALVEQAGIILGEKISPDFLPTLYVARVLDPLSNDVLETANALNQDRLVEYAQPNFITDRRVSYSPDDPYFPKYAPPSVLPSQEYLHHMLVPEAWDLTQGDPGITIAVIDQGVEYTHEDLSGQFVVGFDLTDTPVTPAGVNDPSENKGHGTVVSGIIGAKSDNGLGIAGIAPRSKIMSVRRMFGAGVTDAHNAAVISKAWHEGADIINMSYEGTKLGSVEGDVADSAFVYGRDNGKGCVLVAATGNGSTNAKQAPSEYSSVLAVGGAIGGTYPVTSVFGDRWVQLNPEFQLVGGSNFGDHLDVMGIASVFSTDLMGTAGYAWGTYNNYTSTNSSATSWAAPQISGIAALMLSVNPILESHTIYDYIRETARDSLGIAQEDSVGKDMFHGYGLANAYAAVLMAAANNQQFTPNFENVSVNSPPPIDDWTPFPGTTALVQAGDGNGGPAYAGFQSLKLSGSTAAIATNIGLNVPVNQFITANTWFKASPGVVVRLGLISEDGTTEEAWVEATYDANGDSWQPIELVYQMRTGGMPMFLVLMVPDGDSVASFDLATARYGFPARKQIVNSNFDEGSGNYMAGWQATKDSPWGQNNTFRSNHQIAEVGMVPPNNVGSNNPETGTGLLISYPFVLTDDEVRFRIAGHDNNGNSGSNNYAKLQKVELGESVENNTVLGSTHTTGSDDFSPASWGGLSVGDTVRAVMYDNNSGSGWAWFAVDAFEMDNSVGGGSGGGGNNPFDPIISQDIGSVGQTGSASYANGTYTVKGAGVDIWDYEDGFHFLYKTLSSDGEIVARVASMDDTHEWAKSGVMMRESLNNDSKHAMMVITPNSTNDRGTSFQYRTSTGGSSGAYTPYNGIFPDHWVKLVRSGNTYSGYISDDGTNWSSHSSQTVSMGTNVYVGLVVTAHNNGALNTSTFDNVSLTGTLSKPTLASLGQVEETVRDTFFVAQNFPNPFNPVTTISYSVPVATQIKLTIFNVMGQEIRTLVNAEQVSGKYQVVWNGKDEFGRQVASGIYLYRLVAGDFVDTRKMLILK